MSLGWVVYSLMIVNVKTYTLGQQALCTECVARWLVVSCNTVTRCNTPLSTPRNNKHDISSSWSVTSVTQYPAISWSETWGRVWWTRWAGTLGRRGFPWSGSGRQRAPGMGSSGLEVVLETLRLEINLQMLQTGPSQSQHKSELSYWILI